MTKNRSITFYLVILFLIISCSSQDVNSVFELNETSDFMRLHILNDSTVQFDLIKANFAELYTKLKKIDTKKLDKIYITAEHSVNMGKVIDVELIIGAFEIPLIIYPFGSDSITKKLVLGPDKERLIAFEMKKSGELFYGEKKIINSRNIIYSIDQDLNRIEDPIIILAGENGTSYPDYIEQVDIINTELYKVDSSLKVTAISWGYYEKIDE